MKRLSILCIAMLAVLAFAIPAGARGGRMFISQMTGAQEVPPADPDGSGTATFTVNPGQGRICFDITSEDIDLPIVAAHIHPGAAGEVGPPLVFLLHDGETDADGDFSGCTLVERAVAKDILKHPWAYYVNLHNATFPAGAIRAQLA